MAYHPAARARPLSGAGTALLSFIDSISAVASLLISASQASRRLRLVERLQLKSDAELADLGIRREDIIRHVFFDQYGF